MSRIDVRPRPPEYVTTEKRIDLKSRTMSMSRLEKEEKVWKPRIPLRIKDDDGRTFCQCCWEADFAFGRKRMPMKHSDSERCLAFFDTDVETPNVEIENDRKRFMIRSGTPDERNSDILEDDQDAETVFCKKCGSPRIMSTTNSVCGEGADTPINVKQDCDHELLLNVPKCPEERSEYAVSSMCGSEIPQFSSNQWEIDVDAGFSVFAAAFFVDVNVCLLMAIYFEDVGTLGASWLLVVFAMWLARICLLSQLTKAVTSERWLCLASVVVSFCALLSIMEPDEPLSILAMFFIFQMIMSLLEGFCRHPLPVCKPPLADQPLKVLVVSDFVAPQQHGIALHVQAVVNALRQDGCKVQTFTVRNNENIEKGYYGMPSVKHPFKENSFVSIWPSVKLCKELLFGDWDCVHMFQPNLACWPILILSALAGRPIYVSVHQDRSSLIDYWYSRWNPLHWMLKAYICFAVQLPVFLLATIVAGPTSRSLDNHWLYKYLSPSRSQVFPTSVNDEIFHAKDKDTARAQLCDRLGIPESAKIWLSIGSMEPEKDVAELINAFILLWETHPYEDVRLVLAGDGSLREELQVKAYMHRVPICFLGAVEQWEVGNLYRAADVHITCSASQNESFGLTVLESIACGVPSVMPSEVPTLKQLYGTVVPTWFYRKGDLRGLVKTVQAASAPAIHKQLEHIRATGGFSPEIFWRWQDALNEQESQYRNACYQQAENRVILNGYLSLFLVAVSGLFFGLLLAGMVTFPDLWEFALNLNTVPQQDFLNISTTDAIWHNDFIKNN